MSQRVILAEQVAKLAVAGVAAAGVSGLLAAVTVPLAVIGAIGLSIWERCPKRNYEKAMQSVIKSLDASPDITDEMIARATAALNSPARSLRFPPALKLDAARKGGAEEFDAEMARTLLADLALPREEGDLAPLLEAALRAAVAACRNDPKFKDELTQDLLLEATRDSWRMMEKLERIGGKIDEDRRALRKMVEHLVNQRNNIVPLTLPIWEVRVGNASHQMAFNARLTALVGREQVFERLQSFLHADASLLWWQIAGDGGQGKSRSALEYVLRMELGWHAGFLNQGNLERIDWNTVTFNEPTLIIIDYVANQKKARMFAGMLRSLQERRPAITHKLRILVLERQGYSLEQPALGKVNWFDTVISDSAARQALLQTAFENSSLALESLDNAQLARIAKNWRESRGRPQLDMKGLDALKQFLARGEAREAARPLFAMIFAEAFDAGRTSDFSLEDALKTLLEKERAELIRDMTISDEAQHLSVLANICGELDVVSIRNELSELGQDAMLLLGLQNTNGMEELTDAANRWNGVTPIEQTSIYPRTPDIIAEYQVISTLTTRFGPSPKLPQIIALAWRINFGECVGFLTRLVQDFPSNITAKAVLSVEPSTPVPTGLIGTDSEPINGLLLAFSSVGLIGAVKALLAEGAGAGYVGLESGAFPLLMAAQNGHAEVVTALLAQGADVNQIDQKDGAFPLLQAAQQGHAEVVTALLAQGADVNQINHNSGAFPLLMAQQQGHAEVVTALLAALKQQQ